MTIFVEDVLAGLALVLSIPIAAIGLAAYARERGRPLLVVAVAALLTLAASALMLYFALTSNSPPDINDTLSSLVLAMAVASLYGVWLARGGK